MWFAFGIWNVNMDGGQSNTQYFVDMEVREAMERKRKREAKDVGLQKRRREEMIAKRCSIVEANWNRSRVVADLVNEITSWQLLEHYEPSHARFGVISAIISVFFGLCHIMSVFFGGHHHHRPTCDRHACDRHACDHRLVSLALKACIISAIFSVFFSVCFGGAVATTTQCFSVFVTLCRCFSECTAARLQLSSMPTCCRALRPDCSCS